MTGQTQQIELITISSSRSIAHTDPLFIRLAILKLPDIKKLNELKFYYKIANNLLPSYFREDFVIRNETNHNYFTRHHQDLRLPTFIRNYSRQTLRYSLAKTINEAPNCLTDKVHTHSLKGFSNYVKHYFLSHYNRECHIQSCYVCSSS